MSSTSPSSSTKRKSPSNSIFASRAKRLAHDDVSSPDTKSHSASAAEYDDVCAIDEPPKPIPAYETTLLPNHYNVPVLFPLPKELIDSLTFTEALARARTAQKWFMVNIQQHDTFESQKLNRDIWSSEIVLQVIHSCFHFWQRDASHPEGSEFCVLYKVTQFPYVCIIDYRTGRNMKQWNIKKLQDEYAAASEFMDFAENVATSVINKTKTQTGRTATSSRVALLSSPIVIDEDTEILEFEDSEYPDDLIQSSRGSVEVPLQRSLSEDSASSVVKETTSINNPPISNSVDDTNTYKDINTLLRQLHDERLQRNKTKG